MDGSVTYIIFAGRGGGVQSEKTTKKKKTVRWKISSLTLYIFLNFKFLNNLD